MHVAPARGKGVDRGEAGVGFPDGINGDVFLELVDFIKKAFLSCADTRVGGECLRLDVDGGDLGTVTRFWIMCSVGM